MESGDNQKNIDRLARLRENQRKSRARRQEHVRELEQRLAASKKQAQQKDIEYRLAIQKIEAENRQLKTLLVSVGISPELIEQYLQLANNGTEVDRKVAIPAMKRQLENATIQPCSSKDAGGLVKTSPAGENAHPPAEIPPAEQLAGKPADSVNPSLCKCSREDQAPATWPREEDVLNSTLCAIAEELVSQYNTRGKDPEEIRQRLWSGFRTAGDGCRVQNQVLFQVLDELSNDV